MDIEEVQRKNLLQNGDKTIIGQEIQDSTLDQCWETLLKRSNFKQRQADIQAENLNNLWRKRGIAIEPVKYGIEWAGYDAGVQIGVFKADGTVTVTHSGTEIGQGINTKVAQAVATALSLPLDMVRVLVTSTDKLANGGNTGGSGTSEMCVKAALLACEELLKRLNLPQFSSSAPARSVDEWLRLLKTLPCDVSLNVEGWYSPTENPSGTHFQYYVWGACVSEVELDVLSGEVNTLSSEILYDCGLSLNPDVDIGQIEGGFVMGLGYIMQEKVQYDEVGMLESVGTWEYKPPLAQDIPSVLNVTLLANAPNRLGVLRSKAVGEPSFVLSNSIYFATKSAIMSSRRDAALTTRRGSNDDASAAFIDIPIPMTIDVRQQACLVTPSRFVMPN